MAEDTEFPRPPSLLDIVRPWPIARTLTTHLAVGDLINLSRSSTALRASLHGFGPAEVLPGSENDAQVRDSVNVGLHGTSYWQLLKDVARQTCSSKTHTKGDKVHFCRLCSTLVCEACIVRSSFARGKEDTFRNRCRFFCEECWESGNSSKSRRHPLHLSHQQSTWYPVNQPGSQDDDLCTCTLKENGWLCIECKDKQNYEAASNDRFQCHGLGCSNHVGPDYERRRMCLWCDKTLPRHLGLSRQAWTQKIIEARTRNALSRQADLEEYNRKRLKMMRMSRREMRGEDAVKGQYDADQPQFVRHLDSCCNYRNFISENSVPDGNAVYDSKRGYWTYSRAFLLEIGKRCIKSKRLRRNQNVSSLTWPGTSIFARTIRQCRSELDYLVIWGVRHGSQILGVSGNKIEPPITEDRAAQWVALKTRICDLAFIERLQFFQIQAALQLDYGFDLPWDEFKSMLNVWCLTPLWEDTDMEQAEDLRKTTKKLVKTTTPFKWDRGTAVPKEEKIENRAARIIERLVLAGHVLPLRTNLSGADEGSHWHEPEAVNDVLDVAEAHKTPLLDETSDEEVDYTSREAALAILDGRLKRSATELWDQRWTKRTHLRTEEPQADQAIQDAAYDHSTQGHELGLRRTATVPMAVSAAGLQAQPVDTDIGAEPLNKRAESLRSSHWSKDNSKGRPDKTHEQYTSNVPRSSFSSTTDDFDEDRLSFKSLDSDEYSKNGDPDRSGQPGPDNIANTDDNNDGEWEVVPRSRGMEFRGRD